MKDNEIAALVNRLRDIAVQYHDTQQLRERIAAEIRKAADSLRHPAQDLLPPAGKSADAARNVVGGHHFTAGQGTPIMTTNTNAAPPAGDLRDMVSKALRRAWQLGQAYWQQADSEYTSQHRKSDETQAKFDSLVDETRAALSTAAQPPADGALNTIAAMFHSGEEIDGPDGLAMMVDMSVWNAALDSFEGILGDEMVPAQPPERVPLTDAELVASIEAAGFTTWDSRMWELKRLIEAAHDIKPKEQPNA